MNAIARFARSALTLWLPEGTPRQLLTACQVLTAGTIILWSMTAPDVWTMWAPRAGAAVIIVITALCWLAAWLCHRLGELVDGRLLDVICGLAQSRAREAGRHLQAAAGEHPQAQ